MIKQIIRFVAPIVLPLLFSACLTEIFGPGSDSVPYPGVELPIEGFHHSVSDLRMLSSASLLYNVSSDGSGGKSHATYLYDIDTGASIRQDFGFTPDLRRSTLVGSLRDGTHRCIYVQTLGEIGPGSNPAFNESGDKFVYENEDHLYLYNMTDSVSIDLGIAGTLPDWDGDQIYFLQESEDARWHLMQTDQVGRNVEPIALIDGTCTRLRASSGYIALTGTATIAGVPLVVLDDKGGIVYTRLIEGHDVDINDDAIVYATDIPGTANETIYMFSWYSFLVSPAR